MNAMSTKQSDAWIFVSHSNRDLTAVRRIRNAVEAKGAQPILFFLKQDVPDDLLRAFLKREIAARNFFILCQSEHAAISPFVRFEVEEVQALPHVKRIDIDLDLPWEQQAQLIENLLSDATAFVSYAASDRDAAEPFLQFFAQQDFAVFDPAQDLRPGEPFQHAIQRAIADAARSGYLIQFITAKALHSQWLAAEFDYFLRASGGPASGRHPVIIALEPVSTLTIPPQMGRFHIIDATAQPFAQTYDQIKRALGL